MVLKFNYIYPDTMRFGKRAKALVIDEAVVHSEVTFYSILKQFGGRTIIFV